MNFSLKKASLRFISIFLISFSFSAAAEKPDFNFSEVFNSKLTESEVETLKSGKVLIRNTKNSSNISINRLNDDIEQVIDSIHELKPVYLAEIIQVIPVEAKPDLLLHLKNALIDIPSYKGIPYYSEHNKIWVDLYSKAEITNQVKSNSYHYIACDFYMEPFGDISAKINIEYDEDSIFYENRNTTPIMYRDITCVKPGKMKYLIYAFKYKDCWVLYGIGGVNAPKVPFLAERIELSFMNRIKTFCNFIFTKII